MLKQYAKINRNKHWKNESGISFVQTTDGEIQV